MDKPWLRNYEPEVPATLKYPQTTLHYNLEQAARKHPDAPATIFMDAELNYAQLNELADRFAAGLQSLGVKKGDRVAVYVANSPQFIMAYYGALKAGAVVVPFNPLYGSSEVRHQLRDSGAETAVVMSRFYPIVKEVRSETPLKRVLVTNIKEYFPSLLRLLFTVVKETKEGDRQSIAGDPDTYWYQEFIGNAPPRPSPVAVAPSDTAALIYTGGTTGVPKGAELSHFSLNANALQCRAWMHHCQEGQETILAALPLFHSFGMTTCMNFAVLMSSAMLLIPNPREVASILEKVAKWHPTVFPGVPAMYLSFANFPNVGRYDIRSIRACLSGAAPLPPEIQERFSKLTGAHLVEGYGLSEAAPVTHANPVFGQGRPGSIGLPFPDTEARIVDIKTGTKEVPRGEPGELIVRGPQVMKGYWNMPGETANALRDGWLYTGDIATMDEDGYFRIVDRKKDMIIASGYNVYPRDVEQVLYQHPKVMEAVAAGIPDGARGETVKAYIVLKPGETATPDEFIAYCRSKLAAYKVPEYVEFRTELPKTIVGKVLRRMLVEEEKRRQAAKPPA